MAVPPVVRVEGLREFTRELRVADDRLRKAVPEANQDIAERLVVQPARRRASGQPGATGKLGRSNAIRSARRLRASVVVIGGLRSTEWALGAEFGAIRFGQFQPWRGNQWTGGNVGYAVHPTIRENTRRIEDEYLDVVHDTVRRAAFYQ